MLENSPDRPHTDPLSLPDHVDGESAMYRTLGEALLRPFHYELAQQGINVSPKAAYEILQQRQLYESKRRLQQKLAEQGVDVSPDEAVGFVGKKLIYEGQLRAQRELAEEGIDVSPEEAVALQFQRVLTRFFMAGTGVTDPHEAREGIASDGTSKP